MDESSRRKDEEANFSRSKPISRSVEQATCTKGQDTKEDSRDMRVKKKGNI